MKAIAWTALGAALTLADVSGSAQAQGSSRTRTEPFLHPLFSENAVLQRDRPVPVWGWTRPGTSVVVRLDGQTQTAVAAGDGRWIVSMRPHGAGGPYSLSVADAQTGESATRGNLLFGDVWLCSGQSNMAYDMHSVNNFAAEVAAADFPEIRLIQVPTEVKATPVSSFNGAWNVCSPQSVERFSAVGYFFGRALYRDLKVPIGLIDSSASGTPAQAWVSGPALRTIPDFKADVDAIKAGADANGDGARQSQAWWQNDPGTRDHQEAPGFDDSAWRTIDAPGAWEDKGFADFDGVMWFRRTVDVPAAWAGRDLRLDLGNVDDRDTTFWDGAPVGATDDVRRERRYTVPGARVKAGRRVIAVRVLDSGGGGGLVGPRLSMTSGGETVSLAGAWKAHPGPDLKSLPAAPRFVNSPNDPTVLFNAKIAPLLPGAIKGVVWYQGESNADRMEQAVQYRTLLPTLIEDWRAHLGAETPFYIMQLANFRETKDLPGDEVWPHLREAQLETSQTLPNVGLTVLTDLGEVKNVHFPNKQEAGRRLALTVRGRTYGEKIESNGPTLAGVKATNGAIRLSFDHAQGLNLKGDESRVFAVAGDDRRFYWATPQIVGDTVTLRSPEVSKPIYVRFGWSNNPLASLYNAAGLPASPFRTDK